MEEIVETIENSREDTSKGKPLELVFPPLPVSLWKALPEIPIERIGSGLNRKVRIHKFSIIGISKVEYLMAGKI